MALTFKVDGLVAVIDTIVAAKLAEEERYARECIEARATYKRKWWANHKVGTRALRDYLTRCIRTDVPPEERQVRLLMGKQNTVTWFTEGTGDGTVNKVKLDYYRTDELEGMAALLRAHTEPAVTAHQLKELGTHPKDLEKLFRAAVTAGAVLAGAK